MKFQVECSKSHIWGPLGGPAMTTIVFYHTILYYTIADYTILYYTLFDYTILYDTVLYCIILYHTESYNIILSYTLAPLLLPPSKDSVQIELPITTSSGCNCNSTLQAKKISLEYINGGTVLVKHDQTPTLNGGV